MNTNKENLMRMTLIVLAFLALGLCGCAAYDKAFADNPEGVAAAEDSAIATATGIAAFLPPPFNLIAAGAVGGVATFLATKRSTRTADASKSPTP